MTMNKVYTIEEYKAQGFTEDEAWMVRKTDILFNRRQDWTEKEEKRYYLMVERLGL